MVLVTAVVIYQQNESVSAIPPTPAIEGTIVHTEDWAGQSTLVKAGTYNDKVHFISDGSIILNVTQSP